MKTLLIDTRESNKATIGLRLNNKLISKTVNKKINSQVVLPLIEKILRENKLVVWDIDEIEVFQGPGSFTGLRVGVAIANALSAALNIKVNGSKKPVEAVYK